MNSSEKNHHFK